MNPTERPIPFTGDLVCLVLDGRKTQTRRPTTYRSGRPRPNPFGEPGDVLWIRETFARIEGRIVYRATAPDDELALVDRWTPSIHMPREAARPVLLRVDRVWREGLYDISEADAHAEGLADREAYWSAMRGLYGFEGLGWPDMAVWACSFTRVTWDDHGKIEGLEAREAGR